MIAPLTPVDVKKLKVGELKQELQIRNLDSSGLKPALLQRLLDAIESSNKKASPLAPSLPTTSATAHAEVAVGDNSGESSITQVDNAPAVSVSSAILAAALGGAEVSENKRKKASDDAVTLSSKSVDAVTPIVVAAPPAVESLAARPVASPVVPKQQAPAAMDNDNSLSILDQGAHIR